MHLKENIKVIHCKHEVSDNLLVSVCVQTYNHVGYIKDCLDGILMQKTIFTFEILLGEDESSDGTREICIDYAEKHPDKIRLFLHSRENNIKIGGQPTGRFNFLYNLSKARGKYIALCEGDDYWTDPLKLQKQVEFLEGNEEYVACFHNAIIKNEELNSEMVFSQWNKSKNVLPEEVVLSDGALYPTASLVFKNEGLSLNHFSNHLVAGDWLLMHNLINRGKIYYLNEIMCIYRVHQGGLSGSIILNKDVKKLKSISLIKTNNKIIFLNNYRKFAKKELRVHYKKAEKELILKLLYQNPPDFFADLKLLSKLTFRDLVYLLRKRYMKIS